MSNLLKKHMSRGLLLIVVLCQFAIFGFVENNADNLYSYQWGLKNNGTFFVDRTVLANDYLPLYFDKSINDQMFFDTKEIVDYLKLIGNTSYVAYSTEGFDANWESAYAFFKSTTSKRDAVIAVIDTGVDIKHFELSDSVWINTDEIPNNGIDDDNNGYIDDVNGYNFHHKNANVFVDPKIDVHGTHAAGIMVAKHENSGIKGIAYDKNVKVMPLKVLDENENGYVSSVVAAINYARENGATICNLSLGSYKYEESIDRAIKNSPDMVFVVSAGNGANFNGYSLDEKDVYPAKLNYPNVITVSNVSFDANRYVSANYGTYVDVFAPGTFILSTVPGDNFAYLTGTSMAAPFVAATCAMIYSRYPNVPIQLYKSIIINGATPVSSLMGLSKSAGMLNICNALVMASTF
ncbi:MAG: S8 family serine peptidase [Lachnospiraceae bacterium]|nr:S8 family serine peptidase [Lachnospiraceae bacterium]